ncbi:hypothetical protein K2173_010627 [Erythroxylum novogranatense]|uniref:TF-B3 domain-containing protein n=1 Tax=Erythroxylum novogranatense TaxID=1862640 RepID=A0AAV8U9M7_9ROSI|nr:hypothetical protein K2173_010627 [Erythroxylum novogranatense]
MSQDLRLRSKTYTYQTVPTHNTEKHRFHIKPHNPHASLDFTTTIYSFHLFSSLLFSTHHQNTSLSPLSLSQMSMNQFSTDIPEMLWWGKQQQHPTMEQNQTNITPSSKPHTSHLPHPNSSCPPHIYHHHQTWLNSYNHPQQPHSTFPTQNPTLKFNLKHELNVDQEEQQQRQPQNPHKVEALVVDKEPMFEKPLTPSDVGKLNRLVIPKQHAERYFPLNGDSSESGLLLSFEDESGKCWRFRYSYWNSSQSYVLTKGWSRYVKEKQLEAGDVVLFGRDGDRLFIGWRRRGDSSSGVVVQGSNSAVWSRGLYSSSSSSSSSSTSCHHQPYPSSSNSMQHGHGSNVSTTTSCVPYQPHCLHAGSMANHSTTLGNNSKRRLRLFGVNLECQLDDSEPSTPDVSSLSSHGQTLQQLQSQCPFSTDTSGHMMSNRRG